MRIFSIAEAVGLSTKESSSSMGIGESSSLGGIGESSSSGGIGESTSGSNSVIMALCSVFMDNTVSFFTDDAKLASEIREMTYAENGALEKADFVILRNADSIELIENVYRGSLVDPHQGATVIIEVSDFRGETRVIAEGPGIEGRLFCELSRFVANALDRKADLNMEYPSGFEMIFVNADGEIIAVPRRIKTVSEVI
jgi:alpha-D-ribose 1-methylphosphonate 5-triphosphate synthase subunit PhnH